MNSDKALELARLAYPNDENLRIAYMLGVDKGYEFCREEMLEDAAETFNRKDAAKMWDYEGKTEGEIVKSAFKAGAKWQAEHTEDYPMPEDTVLFQKGVAEGKRLMMEDAIEVPLYRDGDFFASIDIDMATLGYTDNDKVKIIIVKED